MKLIEKAVYRTLLATCGSEEIPRFEYPSRTYYYLPSAEPHVASNVRYIAFSMSTNTLLTPCKARCGTFTLLPISLPCNDIRNIRKYSRINQKFSHLFCSHKDSPYFCCVYPTPVARRCASNVCEGASDWCSIAQPARGFRVRKLREHTYNIYKKSVSAALSLVR